MNYDYKGIPSDDSLLATWKHFLRTRNIYNATFNTMFTWLSYNFPDCADNVQYYWDKWDGRLEPNPVKQETSYVDAGTYHYRLLGG